MNTTYNPVLILQVSKDRHQELMEQACRHTLYVRTARDHKRETRRDRRSRIRLDQDAR